MAPAPEQEPQLPHPSCFRDLYIYKDCKCAYLSPKASCTDKLGSHYHPLVDVKRSTFDGSCKPCELLSVTVQKEKKAQHWMEWLQKLEKQGLGQGRLREQVAEFWERDKRSFEGRVRVVEGRKDGVEGWEFVGGKVGAVEAWREV